MRLAGAIWAFWDVRGYLSEGRIWLEGLLTQVKAEVPSSTAPALRMKILLGAGALALGQSDYSRATMLYSEGLTLSRAIGDKRSIAGSLNSLGLLATSKGIERG